MALEGFLSGPRNVPRARRRVTRTAAHAIGTAILSNRCFDCLLMEMAGGTPTALRGLEASSPGPG